MNKRIIIILAFTILLTTEVVSAQDDRLPLNPPPGYYGSITLDGQPAPAGTTIIAKIGGEVRGSLTTTESGSYGDDPGPTKLWIRGYQNETGSTVTFYVNGVAAQQTAGLSSAGITNKADLTFTGMPVSSSGASGSGGGAGGGNTSGNGTGGGVQGENTSSPKSTATPEVTQSGITTNINENPKATEDAKLGGALSLPEALVSPVLIVGVIALLIAIIVTVMYFNRK